jgi:hypothetical protein
MAAVGFLSAAAWFLSAAAKDHVDVNEGVVRTEHRHKFI